MSTHNERFSNPFWLQAPNLVQLEAWTHRFRDIETYLRSRGYGEEAMHYYKACISYLLHSDSKQAMHDRFRKEFESVWPKDFIFYYRQKLLPRSGRLGQWAMAKMKIVDDQFLSPHTNPQESFHTMCQHFAGWANLSIDQVRMPCKGAEKTARKWQRPNCHVPKNKCQLH